MDKINKNSRIEYINRLPEACEKFAEADIGETNELRMSSLSCIQEWLENNKNINANPNPVSLLYFLRSCKFDVEKSKEKIKSFYRMRYERSEWFSDRNPFDPVLSELLSLGVFLPLKKKDDQNRQIVIIRTGAHDPKKFTYNDVLKASKMLLDYLLYHDETISIYGINAYFDMQNLQLGHALQLTPLFVKRAVNSWETYPVRIKRMNFLMVPRYVVYAINLFKSFMSEKLKSRLFISSNSVEKPTFLPKELGGDTETYESLAKYWKEVLENNGNFFEHHDKFKSIS